jgi:hypothetical protein
MLRGSRRFRAMLSAEMAGDVGEAPLLLLLLLLRRMRRW